MDKYPVLEGKQAAGELTVSGESLYTVFDVSCARPVVRLGGGGDRQPPHRRTGAGGRPSAYHPPVFPTADSPAGCPPQGRDARLG